MDNLFNRELNVSKNVAVIGSSSNLLDNSFGKKIDSYESIFRFNRAVIDGYEELVGSREDFRVVNNHVLMNRRVANKKFTNQDKDFVKKLKDTNVIYIGPVKVSEGNSKKYMDDSNEFYIFNYKKVKKLKSVLGYNDEKNPTVGCITVMTLVYMGFLPHLFGFDLEGEARTHYWEKRDPESVCHNKNYECNFFKKLQKEGKLSVNG